MADSNFHSLLSNHCIDIALLFQGTEQPYWFFKMREILQVWNRPVFIFSSDHMMHREMQVTLESPHPPNSIGFSLCHWGFSFKKWLHLHHVLTEPMQKKKDMACAWVRAHTLTYTPSGALPVQVSSSFTHEGGQASSTPDTQTAEKLTTPLCKSSPSLHGQDSSLFLKIIRKWKNETLITVIYHLLDRSVVIVPPAGL